MIDVAYPHLLSSLQADGLFYCDDTGSNIGVDPSANSYVQGIIGFPLPAPAITWDVPNAADAMQGSGSAAEVATAVAGEYRVHFYMHLW